MLPLGATTPRDSCRWHCKEIVTLLVPGECKAIDRVRAIDRGGDSCALIL